MVDRSNPLLKIDARLYGAQNLIACAEHAIEQLKLLIEQLVDALIRCVGLVQEVHDNHVEFLSVTVTTADTLLNALRIPWKIVVHDEITKLQIDAFRRRLGRNQNCGLVSEMIDQRRP